MGTEKRQAFLKYKSIRNWIHSKIREIQDDYREGFTNKLQIGIYVLLKQVWRTVRNQQRETKEYITTTKIKKDTWIKYFVELYDPQQTRACFIPDSIKINVGVINEEVFRVIKTSKNRKSRGMYDITNEMYKYGG